VGPGKQKSACEYVEIVNEVTEDGQTASVWVSGSHTEHCASGLHAVCRRVNRVGGSMEGRQHNDPGGGMKRKNKVSESTYNYIQTTEFHHLYSYHGASASPESTNRAFTL